MFPFRVRTTGILFAGAALAGSGVLAAPSAQAASGVRYVSPGQSVQAAVDAAGSGGTVVLAPGTYPGDVSITQSGVRLIGPRTGRAEIVPGTSASCGGYGICVFGSSGNLLKNVRIDGVTVTGFAKTGVMGRYTDGFTVTGVRSRDNGEHGIGEEFSVRGVFTGNTARDNAQSGLFVGDATAAKGTKVAGNSASGNRIGVHIRRGRDLGVTANTLTGNCAGVFVVGDSSTPVAGDLDITGNRIVENNRYCPPNPRIAYIQGSGIVLTGAQQVRITGNTITGNQGASPMSGGIVMAPSVSGAPTSFQTVVGNTVRNNVPADLAERDPRGSGTRYLGNSCARSEPAGNC
ncbi:MAG: hypothetical protein HOV66_10945 [Streptomycetaceae bacterium]|nr:hypothetical protein [Streptomycetaceae bacterium]NUS55357.1 hypothetical protein [Streptomycetaceae bacterium]